MATKLQKQYDCISKMMLNLQDTADNNKKSESYSRLSTKCVNITAGGEITNKGKYLTKTKRNTTKRIERRRKSSEKSVSYQKTTEAKFIKNRSNNK